MKLTLEMDRWLTVENYRDTHESKTVTVELVERKHYLADMDSSMKSYTVLLEGEPQGYIERSEQNTDRHYGRIRVPGKGRPAWQWCRQNGERSSAGVHESNRAEAVAEVLGYEHGRQLKTPLEGQCRKRNKGTSCYCELPKGHTGNHRWNWMQWGQ